MDTKYQKILVGFDNSPASTVALDKAITIAKKCGSEIHVVYVDSNGSAGAADSVASYLNEMKSKTGIPFQLHQKKGRAYKEIVHAEREIGADLIIAGSHGVSGFMPMWIGSTAFRVVSASKCPVFTLQESAGNLSLKNLIVPIIDTPESRQKLGPAAEFATLFGSTVHVLCVDHAKDNETQGRLAVYESQAEEFMRVRGVPCTTDIKFGVNVAQAVIDFAKEKSGGVIFMMTERETSGMFMGTVAQQLINHSPIPVMSIHNKHVDGVAGGGY